MNSVHVARCMRVQPGRSQDWPIVIRSVFVANYDSCIGPVPERYTTKHGQVRSTTTFTYKEEWSVEKVRLITVRSKQEEA